MKKETEDLDSGRVAQVFSKTRDLDVINPYHLDGDIGMYEEEKLAIRNALSRHPEIREQINRILGLYDFGEGVLSEQEYKRMQRKMGMALRPDIDEEELEFTVD